MVFVISCDGMEIRNKKNSRILYGLLFFLMEKDGFYIAAFIPSIIV